MAKHGKHDKKPENKKYKNEKKGNDSNIPPKNTRLSYLNGYDPGSSKYPKFLEELPETKVHRYCPKELSYLLQQNAEKRDISQFSAAAQHRLKLPVRMCETESDAQKLVKEWFPVFDEMFFFSTIGQHLQNGIHIYNDFQGKYDGIYDSSKSWIEINVGHDLGKRYCERRYLATLLHEMLHAFLETFSCDRKCCQDKVAEVKGHGSVWCNAMVKIKDKFEPLAGWEADFNIGSSVMLEMEESEWQPRKDQLDRWGLLDTVVFNEKLGKEVSFIRSKWSKIEHSVRHGDDHHTSNQPSSQSSNRHSSKFSSQSSSQSSSQLSTQSPSQLSTQSSGHSSSQYCSQYCSHQKSSRPLSETNQQRSSQPKIIGKKVPKSSHPQFMDKLPNPKTHCFHPRELSYLIQLNANKLSFSKLPKRAQQLLRKRVPTCRSESDVRHLMKEWASVFDEIFFFGQVVKHLKGGIVVYDKPNKSIHGLQVPSKKRLEINTAHYRADREDFGKKEHGYITTLLHEMLHAFLDIYTCQKWCCWRKLRNNGDWCGFTGEGHRAVWCNAMIKLQVKFEEFVGWPADCGIAVAVMSEMQDDEEDWQPTEAQLRRWGLWRELEFNDKFGRETSFLRDEWPDARHGHRHYYDDESDDDSCEGTSDESCEDTSDDEWRSEHHHNKRTKKSQVQGRWVVCCGVM